MKNRYVKTTAAALKLSARQKLVVSGTPIQNRLQEMHTLFQIVQPDLLGDYKNFKKRYEVPIKEGNLKDATRRQVELKTFRALELKGEIQPYILRRTKEEVMRGGELSGGVGKNVCGTPSGRGVLFGGGSKNGVVQLDCSANGVAENLALVGREGRSGSSGAPAGTGAGARSRGAAEAGQQLLTTKKHEILVWLPLRPKQRERYEAFLESDRVKRLLREKDDAEVYKMAFKLIHNLKTLCLHPVLALKKDEQLWRTDSFEPDGDETKLDQSEEGLRDECAKVHAVAELCRHWRRRGKKFLLLSFSKQLLDLLEFAVFDSFGFSVLRIDGDVKPKHREEILERFQNPLKNSNVHGLIGTIDTIGQGLTLTAATRLILFEPNWNPTKCQQAMDRMYRLGQTADQVFAYRFMLEQTMEEHVYCLQNSKKGLAKVCLEEENQMRHVSSRDLKQIFSMERETPARGLLPSYEFLDGEDEEIQNVLGEAEEEVFFRDGGKIFDELADEAIIPHDSMDLWGPDKHVSGNAAELVVETVWGGGQ